MTWRTWRAAMDHALYGPGGFYTRGEAPGGHFRTSTHTGPPFAEAVLALARRAGLTTVVDMGAGGGELLRRLAVLDPDLTLLGVDLAPRPADLPATIGWEPEPPELPAALVLANEWLDNVPLDVAETTPDGPRLVEVDRSGAERPGPSPTAEDLAWLHEWWPHAGRRSDVGRSRDQAWAGLLTRMRRGVAVAVDYAHRRAERPPDSTLTGYRHGRVVPPVPDGSCDLTAHVALDACAAAGERAGANATLLTTQRHALTELGVSGARPPRELAQDDPVAYLRALERAGEAGELTHPDGLGGFGWLVQTVGQSMPLVQGSAGTLR